MYWGWVDLLPLWFCSYLMFTVDCKNFEFICVCVHTHKCLYVHEAPCHVPGSKVILFFLLSMGPGHEIKSPSLFNKCFYLLSHLSNPVLSSFKNIVTILVEMVFS